MNTQNRLQLIRDRVKARPTLTEQGATILEELRKEDADLGGVAAFGEVLAPDNVKENRPERTEDENEPEMELISPLMRAATED